MSAILLLAACSIGLELFAIEDSGRVRRGSPGQDAEPVAVPIEEHVYRVDLADITLVSPQALSVFADLIGEKRLLFYVEQETEEALLLDAALAGDDGLQNPCDRVEALPAADWTTNPVFTLDESQLPLTVSGEELTLKNALLSATISEDGERWSDGMLHAEVDTREFAASLQDDVDLCAILADFDEDCEPCSDGEEFCFTLEVEDVAAQRVETDFDPSLDGTDC